MKNSSTYLLVLGVALASIFCSCEEKKPMQLFLNPDKIPSMTSHNHIILSSRDGIIKWRFSTPLLERYEFSLQPYVEFTKGVLIETFADSLMNVDSYLKADYAKNDETQRLWVARGNVVVANLTQGRTIYTEELFWDEKQNKIYTTQKARVIDNGSVHIGYNFEADASFESWSFRRTTGQIEVEDQPQDSVQ